MRIHLLFLLLLVGFAAEAQTSFFGFEPNDGRYPADVLFARQASSSSVQMVTRDAMLLPYGVKVQIADVSALSVVTGVSPLATVFNYYRGGAPAQWKLGAQQFASVALGEISPGIQAAFGNELERIGSATTAGLGSLKLYANAGVDLSRVRVKVLNAGTSRINGPTEIWFMGGNVAGIFPVRITVTQINGTTRIPAKGELKIESGETLSIAAPDLDPRHPAEVNITFPNFESASNAAGGATPWLQAGTIGDTSRFAAHSDAFVMRLNEAGKPVWVTIFGGNGVKIPSVWNEIAGGAGIFLSTDSADLPVTSNAPFPKLTASGDGYVALLDGGDGKLRNASYAGLSARSFAETWAAPNPNELVFAGGTMENAGFLMRWQMSENRRVFKRDFDAPVRSIAMDSRMRILYATAEMKTGLLSAAGDPEGLAAVTKLPADLPTSGFYGPKLLFLPGDEYLVSYGIGALGSSKFNGRTMAGKFSTKSSTSLWTRRLGFGMGAAEIGITPTGNLKFLLAPSAPDAPTTARARIVSQCLDTSYFTILSSAGETLHAEFVPSKGFSFDQENEPVNDPPARVACIAQTAGREPSARLAPGQLITVTGGGFGPASPAYAAPDATGKYPMEFGGFQVRIDGVAAPVIAIARGLVAVQVPFENAQTPSPAVIEVIDRGTFLNPLSVNRARYALGLFDTGERDATGFPRLAALNQDGTVNSRENPAAPGSVVSLFGSGLGQLSPALETGGLNPVPPAGGLAESALSRRAIGGQIEYMGTAPGLSTSVMQLNLRLDATSAGAGVRNHYIGVVVSDNPNLFLYAPTGFIFVR